MNPYYTAGKKRLYVKSVVFRIHSIHTTVGKKYPDGLLLPAKFWIVHPKDTLSPHEATGEDLWMAVKWHNWRC